MNSIKKLNMQMVRPTHMVKNRDTVPLKDFFCHVDTLCTFQDKLSEIEPDYVHKDDIRKFISHLEDHKSNFFDSSNGNEVSKYTVNMLLEIILSNAKNNLLGEYET